MGGDRKDPTPHTSPTNPTITSPRALFSTVWPLSSHEVDGVRKEKERLTDDCWEEVGLGVGGLSVDGDGDGLFVFSELEIP